MTTPAAGPDGPSSRYATACSLLLMSTVIAVGLISLHPGRSFDLTTPVVGEGIDNLTPFATIRVMASSDNHALVVANICGNVLMYLPVGLFICLLEFRLHASTLRAAGVALTAGLAVSAGLKVAGRLLGQAVDVDYILFNLTGVALGTGAALFAVGTAAECLRARPTAPDEPQPEPRP